MTLQDMLRGVVIVASCIYVCTAADASTSASTNAPSNPPTSTSLMANVSAKAGQWSTPDTGDAPTTSSGFSAIKIIPHSKQQDDKSASGFITTYRPSISEEPTAPSDKSRTQNVRLQQDLNNHGISDEYLKSFQKKHKQDLYNQYQEIPKSKIVFDDGVSKPVKFENDFYSTEFAVDMRAPSKGLVVKSKDPYPYPYVNAMREPTVEPAPTASAHQTVFYQGKGTSEEYDSTNKGGMKKKGEFKPKSVWDKVARLLTAFIPLGLFLAALPPNVLSINSTNPTGTGRSRSADSFSSKSMELFEKYGFDSLNDAECENRVFCEISLMGATSNGNVIQQGFWQLAHDTPENMAEALGFRDIFKAVRNNACNIFYCPEKKIRSNKEHSRREGEEATSI